MRPASEVFFCGVLKKGRFLDGQVGFDPDPLISWRACCRDPAQFRDTVLSRTSVRTTATELTTLIQYNCHIMSFADRTI
jgi:hypothetical protein